MIDKTLLKQTIKSNIVLWIIITAVLALCLVAMGRMSLDMAGQAFYQLLPGLLSGLYIVITANKLLAAQVDRGTMAYVLSTPIKRSQVAVTQAVFLVGSLLLMFAITSMSHIFSTRIAAGSISAADVSTIINLNLGLFVLTLAFSGICFLASSLFNLSRHAIAVGGGIVGAFLLLHIVSMFGESLKWLGNLTIVSLYDISSVLSGTSEFILKFIILACIGLIAYVIGISVFTKKDLPL